MVESPGEGKGPPLEGVKNHSSLESGQESLR